MTFQIPQEPLLAICANFYLHRNRVILVFSLNLDAQSVLSFPLYRYAIYTSHRSLHYITNNAERAPNISLWKLVNFSKPEKQTVWIQSEFNNKFLLRKTYKPKN